MKTRAKISYIILKYDDRTDSIYTKTSNNEKHIYQAPSIHLDLDDVSTLSDVKKYLLEQLFDLDSDIDESHVFIPTINVTLENETLTYDYVVLILETTNNPFASMNYESWQRVIFDHDNQVWKLNFESGLVNPIDYSLKNRALEGYTINLSDNDSLNFVNVMHFVNEKTQDFPILGLMSGSKFTMKQVLHYQDLLGMEALKAGNNATFESQYSDSIQAVKDDRLTTSYRIKNEYLQK